MADPHNTIPFYLQTRS